MNVSPSTRTYHDRPSSWNHQNGANRVVDSRQGVQTAEGAGMAAGPDESADAAGMCDSKIGRGSTSRSQTRARLPDTLSLEQGAGLGMVGEACRDAALAQDRDDEVIGEPWTRGSAGVDGSEARDEQGRRIQGRAVQRRLPDSRRLQLGEHEGRPGPDARRIEQGHESLVSAASAGRLASLAQVTPSRKANSWARRSAAVLGRCWISRESD